MGFAHIDVFWCEFVSLPCALPTSFITSMRLRNFSSFRYFATSGASSICLRLSCADQCKRVSLGISLDSLEYFPVNKPLKELNSKSHALNIHCTVKNFKALEVLVIFFTLEQRILMIALKHDSSTSKQTPLEDSRAKHQDLRFYTRQTLRAPSLCPKCCTLARNTKFEYM